MKESFPKLEIQKPKEKPNLAYEKHQDFFSEKIKAVTENSLLGLGLMFSFATIFEFATGQPVSDLVSAYADQLPDIANQLIHNLSDMPLVMKGGGGVSMLSLSNLISNSRKK